MDEYEGWENRRLNEMIRAADRCAELQADNARLREAIRKALEVSYPPGYVYRILKEAVNVQP